MKKLSFILLIFLLIACSNEDKARVNSRLRAPAYPLITIDTYTNAWLFGDTLYQIQPTHWTGKEFPLLGVIRVDGESYRFMGVEQNFLRPVIKMGEYERQSVKYSLEPPSYNWIQEDFDDSLWQEGCTPFGKRSYNIINTLWDTGYLWVRKNFLYSEDMVGKRLFIEFSHDDDVEIYINGHEIVSINDRCQDNVIVEIKGDALASLTVGENLLAVYCRDYGGGAYLDFGISVEEVQPNNFKLTAHQDSVTVLPTQTMYYFTCGPVNLELVFTAPLLMDDLELMARPINYITYNIKSNDEKAHHVELYLEAGQSWAQYVHQQESESFHYQEDDLLFLKTGTKKQDVLGRRGDDVRIDWGYFYLAANAKNTISAIGKSDLLRKNFNQYGDFQEEVDNENYALSEGLSFIRNLGKVKSSTSGKFMLGYDDVFSVQYFNNNLRPYWNKNGNVDIHTVFSSAKKEYKKIKEKCDKFDVELMEEATQSGGIEYAELCALAYRQSVSAHKLLEAPNGDLLFLSKENFSSGSVATVDVSYPSSPLFLLYNVDLMKGMLNPIFYYVESGQWKHPFAPHDVGLYPIANGQLSHMYLPVEESGNMLILTTAIATMEGNAEYALEHWETLSRWADFLVEKGFDPEYQINTDVFSGHSAHNTNLSIKAIQGIASYGRLADMLGFNDIARKYTSLAREMALEWVQKADDGDYYRFAFDQPGTWSQKYNLVWDKIMKIHVFPHEVLEKEIAHYLTVQNKYGLPLDSRHLYTKADWIVWSATLSRSITDFQALIHPLYNFVNETTDRIPMSDWYWTDKPEHVDFRARSVLGGYFIKMMEDKLIFNPSD